MNRILAVVSCAIVSCTISASSLALAADELPVRSGIVIRGMTVDSPPGGSGTQVGTKCDFTQDPQDAVGRLTDSPVFCTDMDNKDKAIAAMPSKYNAYCVVANARNLRKADLYRVSSIFSSNRCTLSGITPRDAAQQFQGAQWR